MGGVRKPGRILLIRVLVALAVWYAVQGGEYSTTALIRQHRREQTIRASVDSLQRDVDSLRELKRRLQTDPSTQERIAREEFGMVRGDREILFRFVDPDSMRSGERER